MGLPSIQELKQRIVKFGNKPLGPKMTRVNNALESSYNKTFNPVDKFLANINTRPLSSRVNNPIGKVAAGIVETPYTFLTSVPKTYGQTRQEIASGGIFTKEGQQRTAGRFTNAALDTLSGGLLNKGRQFIQAAGPAVSSRAGGALKDLVIQGAKTGFKTGAGYGAGYGFGGAMEQNQTPGRVTLETLKGGAFGGLMGGAIGGGIPAISGLIKAGKHDFNVARGKSYGKPEMLPERILSGLEEINGRMFPGKRIPGQTFDPNTPQFGRAAREVGEAIPRPGMSIQDVSGDVPPQFSPKTKPMMKEPSIDDMPLLSGRTPIAGVNDTRPSAIQTSRQIMTGKGKSVMVTGAPEDLSGTTAQVTKMGKGMNRVEINREPAAVNAVLRDTPLLPPGQTPDVPRIAQSSAVQPTHTIDDIEKALYGHTSEKVSNKGKSGVGVIGDYLRKGEAKADDIVSGMLSSQNGFARMIGNTLRGFMGTVGKSDELLKRTAQFHGGGDYGAKLAEDLRTAIPNNTESLARIHSNLDPDLYKGKVATLTPDEKEAASLLRLVSDVINDTNYKNGFISQEQWMKNRGGKYIARAYDEYDMPPEIADFVKTANAKFDLNPFKKRGDLSEWKIDNSIKDPVYLMQKRLQQTLFNDSTKRMFDWLGGNKDYTSTTERGGFTKISDHPAYGNLAGKWVRKDVMESIQGLYFEHKALQGLYEGLKWFDRNPVRRGLKKGMTVYNPPVRVGNNVGNYVFAWLGGVNPVTFTDELVGASKGIKANDALSLKLKQDGILGTGTHRGDIVAYANELKSGVTDKNILMQIDDIASKSYGFVDDRAKYAFVRTMLKRGVSYDEAVRRAGRAFQNYHTVGFLYDIGAKIPILGNAFVRFQASLASILKSAAVDHPIRLVSTGLVLKFLGDAASAISGETEEDRKVREERVGAPHIPFTSIPLEFQTPWGAVNVARMLGVYSANPVGGNSVSNDLSRMMPFKDPTDPRSYGGDPLVGPMISSAITGVDFRGKKIADPNETKYQPSTLTTGEKAKNIGSYLQRAYTPAFLNSMTDVNSSLQGKEDFYGRTRSPLQAISSAAGVKVEQYGPQQAQDQRIKNQQFAQYKKEDTKKGVNSVLKQLQAGTIDQATADKRIKGLTSGLSDGTQSASASSGDSRIVANPLGGYSYTDSNGDFKTVDSMAKAEKNVAKMDFADSDKNIMEWKDRVFRKNEDGTVQDMSAPRYNELLLDAELSSAKKSDDFNTWFSTAKRLYTNLNYQLEDPNVDPLDAIRIKNQISTLVTSAAKFKRYGGFTKPKAPKKRKAIKLKTTSTAAMKARTRSNSAPQLYSKSKSSTSTQPVFTVGSGFKVR